MPGSSLADIQVKVRRLTRSPDENSLTTDDLNNYINTAFLYDFPEHLRLFALRQNFTFYTQPYIDTYESNSDANDPLNNFINDIITVHPPVYIAGVRAFYTQYQNVFYNNWPLTNSVADTSLRGDGTAGPFVGTLASIPVLQNHVVFTCLDINGAGLLVIDYPYSNTQGYLDLPNSTPDAGSNLGTINYVTGEFSVSFANNTQVDATIYSETLPYQTGKPISMLYFNNKFVLRPVPDKVYSVQLEVDIRPTALLNNDDKPLISQWWQYIAYLTAKKIFEDRMDLDSVQMIMPELRKQENLVNRSNIVQRGVERTLTIYTQPKFFVNGWWWGSWPY